MSKELVLLGNYTYKEYVFNNIISNSWIDKRMDHNDYTCTTYIRAI